jgi:hypothetical protein
MLLFSAEAMSKEIILDIPLNITVIQTNVDSVTIKGSDPDWGGKFQLTDKKNAQTFIIVDGISKDKHGDPLFELTIKLKKFKQNLNFFPKFEDGYDDYDDEESLNDSVKSLLGLSIPVKFNGCMSIQEIGLEDNNEYLLYDIGLESFLRNIFIPIGKKLKVGKIITQEFFLFSDDAIQGDDEDSDINYMPLELTDKDSFGDVDNVYAEPILLIKYKISAITESKVYADISGGIIVSPNAKMKPTFKIVGKGVWDRVNPLVNEISINYVYTEKRKKSHMNITGIRKTKSCLSSENM